MAESDGEGILNNLITSVEVMAKSSVLFFRLVV